MATKSLPRRRAPRPAASPARLNEIALLRVRLFEAQGIVELTRFAVASQLENLDETVIINALQVASRVIDEVADRLEASQF